MPEVPAVEDVLRQHVSWKTPEAEVEGVLRLVQRQIRLKPELELGKLYIAVPNKLRLAAMKAACEAARMTVFTPKEAARLIAAGDDAYVTVDFGGAIVLGSYGSIAAMEPEHLFAVSLVEGFYPVGSEAEEALAAEAKVLADAAATIPGTLIFSSFKRVSPEQAETWRLPALRRRREHGKDVVAIAHSRFIDAMYDDAPTLVSGEQFLMTLFG